MIYFYIYNHLLIVTVYGRYILSENRGGYARTDEVD